MKMHTLVHPTSMPHLPLARSCYSVSGTSPREDYDTVLPPLGNLAVLNRPSPADMSFRDTHLPDRSVGPLPSICELVPELPRYHHGHHHSSLSECQNTSHSRRKYEHTRSPTAPNSSPPSLYKRRRLSAADEEDLQQNGERRDHVTREGQPLPAGQWTRYHQTGAMTPDLSPSSRRGSTFSSTGTRTASPRTSPFTNYPVSFTSVRKSPSSSYTSTSQFHGTASLDPAEEDAPPHTDSQFQTQWKISGTDAAQIGHGKLRVENRQLPRLPYLINTSKSQPNSRPNLTENEPTDRAARELVIAPSPSPPRQLPYYQDHSHNPPSECTVRDTLTAHEYHPESTTAPASAQPRVDSSMYPPYPASTHATTYSSPTDYVTSASYNSSFAGPRSCYTSYSPDNAQFHTNLPPGTYTNNHASYPNENHLSTAETKPRKRRGNLPKDTTDKLRAWFMSHLAHPYPTEDEKQQLMDATGLQMNQISNWYINARRRQLPAMAANARAEAEARRLSQCAPNENSPIRCEINREQYEEFDSRQ
ncbi:BgTH12-00840 [Blumeria graminis f. sp. triticale]|uniref:BgTH12-00840 n=1 Tax=Blumeria graminis f. sp. triticale TaxID=1689686 RepID=A0A9W4DP17_BLUGR|nr:BgTH12-00840 [Blumeria graminis f. sp. triticale]